MEHPGKMINVDLMKRCWLMMLLCSGLFVHGQTFSDSLLHVVKSADLTQLQTFLEKSKQQSPREILKRQLVEDFYEMSYETQEVPGNRVCFLAQGGKLIYTRLYSQGKKVYDSENVAAMKSFTKAYSSFFGAKPRIKELFTDTIRYGRGCGFAGVDPPLRSKMESLVQLKNAKELTRMLESIVTEKQLYGVEGLLALVMNGYKLTAHQQKLLDFIRTKKGNYLACSGCIYSTQPIGDAFHTSSE